MTAFNSYDLYFQKPNHFGYGGLDRNIYLRDNKNWFKKLNKKRTKIVPLWNSLNLFSKLDKGNDDPRAIFPNYFDIDKNLNEIHRIIFLGTSIDKVSETFFICIDFSNLSEIEVNDIFSQYGQFYDLKDVSPLIDSETGSILAYSNGIHNWHEKYSYCCKCGGETTISKAGHQRNCLNNNCLLEHFPRTDPAVIMLVHHGNKTLLGRQKIWPAGMYSTLAGFVEPGETLEHAVAREVFEEAGIFIKNVQYHSSQPWPFPSSLMVGFYAEAKSTDIKINKNEIEDVNWFSKEEILNLSEQRKFLPRKISIARRLIDDWMKK